HRPAVVDEADEGTSPLVGTADHDAGVIDSIRGGADEGRNIDVGAKDAAAVGESIARGGGNWLVVTGHYARIVDCPGAGVGWRPAMRDGRKDTLAQFPAQA